MLPLKRTAVLQTTENQKGEPNSRISEKTSPRAGRHARPSGRFHRGQRPGAARRAGSNSPTALLVDGKISLTPGGSLKIESGSQIRVLDLDRVREIRIAPESEEMDRNWRFKEAGQTAKEYFGDPYPVRYLQATVLLAGGESFSGHLYSTVLYVEGAETAQKVLLLSKQTRRARASP